MEYKLNRHMCGRKPTVIREIFTYGLAHPDFLDMSIGEPSPDTFPVESLKEAIDKVYASNMPEALGYGTYDGLPVLIDEIKKWLIQRDFDLSNDVVNIIPGSGYGMDSMTNTLCNEGDVVLSEMFAYPGIANAAKVAGAELVGVPLDDGDNCINVEALDKACHDNPKAKFLYLCPTFGNPTGAVMPNEKRKQVYEVCQKHDIMIYEDDPYSRLAFDHTYPTEIKKLDTDGRVVYGASFSKILAPGMRMGFFVCDKKFELPMQMQQGNPGLPAAMLMYQTMNWLRDNDIEKRCYETAEFYKEKAAWAMECAEKYLPKSCEAELPRGGLFMWLKVPAGLDLDALWHEIMEANVGVVPSHGFSADPEKYPGNAFRICFSTPPKEVVEEGFKIMGEVFRRHFD